MDKRKAMGCVAAIVVLLVCGLLISFVAPLDITLNSRLGPIPLSDAVGALVAMLVGGSVAGRGFRWFALAIVALVWVASLSAVVMLPHGPRDAALSVATVLKLNLLSVALSLLAAWAGAVWGERIAARRSLTPQTQP